MLLGDMTRAQALVDILVFLAGFGLGCLVAGFLGGLALQTSQIDPRVVGVIVTMSIALWIICLIFMIRKTRRQPQEALGLCSKNWAVEIALGLIVCGAMFATMWLTALLFYLFWPAAWADLEKSSEGIKATIPPLNITSLLLMTVVVAFYEELVFRGFLLPRLRRLANSWIVGVIVTSIAFGSLHLYEGYGASIALVNLGIVLCLVTIWRKSVIALVVGHFLFNAATLMYLKLFHSNWV